MSFLRCDSEPQLIDGQAVCASWRFVSDQELMLMASQGQVLSSSDFHVLAGSITSILLAAIGVRFLLRVFFPKGY